MDCSAAIGGFSGSDTGAGGFEGQRPKAYDRCRPTTNSPLLPDVQSPESRRQSQQQIRPGTLQEHQVLRGREHDLLSVQRVGSACYDVWRGEWRDSDADGQCSALLLHTMVLQRTQGFLGADEPAAELKQPVHTQHRQQDLRRRRLSFECKSHVNAANGIDPNDI